MSLFKRSFNGIKSKLPIFAHLHDGFCSSASQHIPVRYELSEDEYIKYWNDGYIILRNIFKEEEMDLLLDTIENDPYISSNEMHMTDPDGLKSKLTLWFHLNDKDLYSMFARSNTLNNIIDKLILSEPYHFHSKIMLKEPKSGGSWACHQDFGYWYNQGGLIPDKMLSVMIAIDDHDIENGCLQVYKNSHHFGRIDHGIYNGQQQIDIERFNIIKEYCELIDCEMYSGDILIWNSLLIHGSQPNKSDFWRRALIMGYIGKDAPIYHNDTSVIIDYEKVNLINDDDILNCGLKGHTNDRIDFLTAQSNIDSFNK